MHTAQPGHSRRRFELQGWRLLLTCSSCALLTSCNACTECGRLQGTLQAAKAAQSFEAMLLAWATCFCILQHLLPVKAAAHATTPHMSRNEGLQMRLSASETTLTLSYISLHVHLIHHAALPAVS